TFDPRRFKDSSDRFAGDDARARRSRTQQHFGAAIMRKNFVRNRGILEADSQHLGPRQLTTFADGIGDFAGLAQANPNAAAFIAYNYQRAEIEATAAFYHFGRAIDEHHLLGEFLLVAFVLTVGVGPTTP